ncbi:MAG: hypothetical protein A2Y33_16705 [Spirochaetes bacterium GWF1_51_8]|nr:MAG: hypothetical protein A2Y33_16705 [Spirochaetes bacterium GWF1_51_8]
MKVWIILFVLITFGIIHADKSAQYYSKFVEAYKKGDKSEALKLIANAYEENPTNNNIIVWYGNMLNGNNQYQEAIKVWKKADSEYDPAGLNNSIACAYLALNDLKSAQIYFQNALSVQIAKPKDNLNSLNGLMGILCKEPDDEKALVYKKAFDSVLEKNPGINSEWTSYLFCKYFLDRAVEYAKAGNELEGAKLFETMKKYYCTGLGNYFSYIAPENYGYEWMKRKEYQKAIEVFEYVFQLRNSYYLTWAYADTLLHTGLLKEAIGIDIAGLKKGGTDEKMHGWVYRQLIDIAGQIGDLNTVCQYEEEAVIYHEKNDTKNLDAIKSRLIKIYLNEAYKATAENKYPDNVTYYKKALEWQKTGLTKPDHNSYPENIKIQIEASEYWENEGKKALSSAYSFKFTILALENFNGVIIDEKKNKTENAYYCLEPDMKKKTTDAFTVFSRLYYYLTGGKVHPDLEYISITNQITEVQKSYWKPSENIGKDIGDGVPMFSAKWASIDHYPASRITNLLIKSDTFILLFPLHCTAGAASLAFTYENSKYIAHKTIQLYHAGGAMSYGLFMHEFFHEVEYSYGKYYKFIAHVYSEEYKKYWPKWYNGQGEMFYQKHILEEMIGNYGIEPLIVK